MYLIIVLLCCLTYKSSLAITLLLKNGKIAQTTPGTTLTITRFAQKSSFENIGIAKGVEGTLIVPESFLIYTIAIFYIVTNYDHLSEVVSTFDTASSRCMLLPFVYLTVYYALSVFHRNTITFKCTYKSSIAPTSLLNLNEICSTMQA